MKHVTLSLALWTETSSVGSGPTSSRKLLTRSIIGIDPEPKAAMILLTPVHAPAQLRPERILTSFKGNRPRLTIREISSLLEVDRPVDLIEGVHLAFLLAVATKETTGGASRAVFASVGDCPLRTVGGRRTLRDLGIVNHVAEPADVSADLVEVRVAVYAVEVFEAQRAD